MALRMVALNRLKNGQFFSRKVIPADVRDAYASTVFAEKLSSDSLLILRGPKQRRAMLSGWLR
jgi:hypothetical protein